MVAYVDARKITNLSERACRECDDRENRRTGNWRSDITPYDAQMQLFELGYGKIEKISANGNKPIEAKVPLEVNDEKVIKLHRYLSQVQAKQRLETCGECKSFCKNIEEKVENGELSLKEPFAIK